MHEGNGFHLPENIIYEILTRLPASSLARFKSVCKEWNSLILSPQFAKSHLHQATTSSNPYSHARCALVRTFRSSIGGGRAAFDDDVTGLMVKIHCDSFISDCSFSVGSCNGLVCFGSYFHGFHHVNNFYFYNPITRQHRRVSTPFQGLSRQDMTAAFGYSSFLEDYRFVVVCRPVRTSGTRVFVYSLFRDNSWTEIKGEGIREIESLVPAEMGVEVDEKLHWLMAPVSDQNDVRIVGFDLVDKGCKLVPMPMPNLRLSSRLSVLSGCLCIWSYDEHGEAQLWMLKRYGAWDSWTKMFNLGVDVRSPDFGVGGDKSVGFIEAKKVFVQTTCRKLLIAGLYQNPPAYETVVNDLGDYEVMSYVESLISPLQTHTCNHTSAG
ncbi:hypothetical protein Ancab_013865 [Ancistrocladus abbreviatus]